MKDEQIELITEALKRNLNNFMLSTEKDKKIYWKNVLMYDLSRLNIRIKEL